MSLVSIDAARRVVSTDTRAVRLHKRRFALVSMLTERPGWVFTRVQIMDGVDMSLERNDRAVDSLVSDTRRVLRSGLGPEVASAIRTAYGVGYYWDDSQHVSRRAPPPPEILAAMKDATAALAVVAAWLGR